MKPPTPMNYCVHCASFIEGEELLWFACLPYNTESADKGESGCVCHACHSKLS